MLFLYIIVMYMYVHVYMYCAQMVQLNAWEEVQCEANPLRVEAAQGI